MIIALKHTVSYNLSPLTTSSWSLIGRNSTNIYFPAINQTVLQYLKDLKERGAKVIIADFYEPAARHIMCQAYRLEMTQAQGRKIF